MKKRPSVLQALGCLAITFCVVNLLWYTGHTVKYAPYAENMQETDFSTFLTPRYTASDEEGYTYYVKYPGYLSFTGNLSVSAPAAEGGSIFTNSLILWPKWGNTYEYGVILYHDGGQLQIYVDQNGEAIDRDDMSIAAEYHEEILALLEKADQKWNIR